MQVLLDTSYLYDLMAAPGMFHEAERRFFAGRAVRIHVSAVSIREKRLKHDARQPATVSRIAGIPVPAGIHRRDRLPEFRTPR